MSDVAIAPEIKEIGDKIANLTIIQAVALKGYLKDTYKIEPAAGGVMMAGGGGGGGAAAPAEKPPEQTEFAVVLEAGILLARRTTRVLPEKRFIETEMLRQILLVTELPFAANACGVARLLEQVRERGRVPIEQTKFDVVSNIVDAGHQLRARGRAERLHMTVLKAHPRRGEPIEVRRLIGFATVRRHGFVPKIIRHDENDIGFSLGGVRRARQQRTGETGRDEPDAENGELGFHGIL